MPNPAPPLASPPETNSAEPRSAEPCSAIDIVEGFLRQGEPLLAYNAVQVGLAEFPGNLRLRQLKGLAVARSGDVERANRLLGELAAEHAADAETLGMLARTHKDLALGAKSRAERTSHLEAAFRIYHDAYAAARRTGVAGDAWYTGINSAAIAVWQGNLDAARRIALEVRAICIGAQTQAQAAGDYWLEATLGEAALILGMATESATHYRRAVSLSAGRFGNLASTRRQALSLAPHLSTSPDWISEILHIPPVVMFTGHMIDQPDRAHPRFPLALERTVAAAARARLEALRPLAAYGSAACGSDILCLEAMQQLGGETHIVLPFPADEFHRVSVDIAPGGWGTRFDRVLAAATSVTVTSDHRAHGSTATFDYANLILTGMARLRAGVLQTRLSGLAIWDERPSVSAGGAASLVALWRSQRMDFDEVKLTHLTAPPAAATSLTTSDTRIPHASLADETGPTGFTHEIRAMLFGDVVGFSRLSEDQTPSFITQFLGAVAALNDRSAQRPEHVETSGDGLYMVFGNARDAGDYALQLNHLVTTTDWSARGLPGGLNIRIALHCGPVYVGRNPVTRSPLYTGPHTSRTARIEPVTPPGQVYASSAFAAVAAATGATGFTLQYVGRIPLAKGYGLLGLYHLSPKQD